jgi:hypothetical protein
LHLFSFIFVLESVHVEGAVIYESAWREDIFDILGIVFVASRVVHTQRYGSGAEYELA